jgi:hypothetical protein
MSANRVAMLEKLADLDAEHAKAVAGGGERYVERHHARGKLLPRERIELLIDPGSAFLELSPLAGWGSDFTVGASIVTGIGVIEGVECVITANDPTVKGGASNPWTVKKVFRAAQIAEENGLPTVALVESGGADLPTQKEIFIPGGKLFRDITRASARKEPTVALVFGNSTAGGAYVPGMSDYTVMVKEQAKVFLGGPPLVKMATGEESDDESLGGAEMHARTSGLADYLAQDEHDAIRIGRRIVARLNWRKARPEPGPYAEPDADPDGLLDLVPSDLKEPFDPREVIARVVDGAGSGNERAFDEFKPLYGDSVHPARQPGRHPAAVPPQHDRLHGRRRVRAGRDHQARRDDDQRRQQLHRPAPQRDHGGVVRRRQLRHERPRLRSPLPLHLAVREVGRDGAGPARRRALDRGPCGRRGEGHGVRRGDRRGDARLRRAVGRGAVAAALPLRDALRRRRDRPAGHPHRARHLPVGDRHQAVRRHRPLRRLQDVSQ